MFIAFFAAEADAAADAGVEVEVEELLLLQAASASTVAVTAAATAATRLIYNTAKLLCACSLGGGLADSPVSRVPARLTGFLCGINGLRAAD